MVECKYGGYYGTDIAEIAEELNVTPFAIVSQLMPRSLILFKPFLQKRLIAALSNLFGAMRETMAINAFLWRVSNLDFIPRISSDR
jgi:hypothetical protein